MVNMKEYFFKKKCHIFSLLLGTILVGLISLWRYVSLVERGPIYTFQDDRDLNEALDLFKEDAYLLYSSPDYSAMFALKTRSPNKDVAYLGKMHIKVMRVDGKLVGLVTYYMMRDGVTAHILFLCVHKDYRRKGYGRMLMNHAIEQIKLLGAKRIKILTRIENIKAQSLYRSLGFQDDYIDPRGFIYFLYPIHG